MNLARLLLLVLIGSSCSPAQAFQVEGFHSGMTKAEVEAKLAGWNRVSEVEPHTIVAIDKAGNASSFNFCQGKLVSMQQNLKPTLRQFSLAVRDFNSKFGQPFSSAAGSRIHAQGQIDEIGIWWRDGNEYVSVYYMGTPLGESLSVSYQTPNQCFKVPR